MLAASSGAIRSECKRSAELNTSDKSNQSALVFVSIFRIFVQNTRRLQHAVAQRHTRRHARTHAHRHKRIVKSYMYDWVSDLENRL